MTRSLPSDTSAPDGEQCVPNIGPSEQRRRLEAGVNALMVALVLAPVLMIAAVPRVWLLVVAFPLWVAGTGIFQYREQT